MKVTARSKKTYTLELEMTSADLSLLVVALKRAGENMTGEEPNIRRVRCAILDCIDSARNTTAETVTISRPCPDPVN
jgi:hypothetical protein